MSRSPDEWTEKEWEAHDAALDRLLRRSADQFARDLDLLGWKIVSQRDPDPGETLDNLRWSMNGSKGPCPWWAKDLFNEPPPAPKPPTVLPIKGGKSLPDDRG
jgi:hypothetical protein